MSLFFERFGVYLAWVIALASTLGSLYLSEVQALAVCNACWYQRVFMYSLVVLLGLAAFYNDRKVTLYALPISTFGFLIAAYHFVIQKWPSLYVVNLCGNGPSCTDVEFALFGWLTIPLMSLCSFSLVIVLLLLSRGASHE